LSGLLTGPLSGWEMSGKKGKIDQIGSDYGRTNPAILPVWSVCGGVLLEWFAFSSRMGQAAQ